MAVPSGNALESTSLGCSGARRSLKSGMPLSEGNGAGREGAGAESLMRLLKLLIMHILTI
jgi:hypothetical protein